MGEVLLYIIVSLNTFYIFISIAYILCVTLAMSVGGHLYDVLKEMATDPTAYGWNFNKVAFVVCVAASSYIFFTQEMYVLMSLSIFSYVAAKCVKAQTYKHFTQ